MQFPDIKEVFRHVLASVWGYICVGLRRLLADGGSADGTAITYGEECLIPPSRSAMLFSVRGVRIAFTYHLVFLVPVISGWKNL